jgi:hypothetical protein
MAQSQDKKDETIIFHDPPAKGKEMAYGLFKQYWEKLKCFELHQLKEEKPTKDGAEFVYEYRPFLFKKPDSAHVAYMWDADKNKIDEKDLDEVDRAFLKNREEGFVLHKLYGYHTYGGYYGFFRPDLNEVIHLVARVVPDPAKVKRIYVTTDTHPKTGKFIECFDYQKDMHRALTLCYVC